MASVLVVDDAPGRSSKLVSALERSGFDVSEIAGPERLHEAPRADLVVLDTRVASRTVFDRLRSMTERGTIVMVTFRAYEALDQQLEAAELKLSERKIVER